jgi:hypothetical protein
VFLVGHAIVAFLIAYGISRGSKLQYGTISFALVMLIATLPDIDIITQEVGFMPHKTYTHSAIPSLAISSGIFIGSRFGFRQSIVASLAYAIAYAQHLLDDIVIGTLNIAYPFGDLSIGIGVNYGSLAHLIIEALLLSITAVIIVSKSFRKQHDTALFRFGKTDKISYTLLILSFGVSFVYLLQQMRALPRLFIDTQLELALFVLLHIAAIALVSFQVFVARRQNVVIKAHSGRLSGDNS